MILIMNNITECMHIFLELDNYCFQWKLGNCFDVKKTGGNLKLPLFQGSENEWNCCKSFVGNLSLHFFSVFNFNNFAIAVGYSCLDMVCGLLHWTIDYILLLSANMLVWHSVIMPFILLNNGWHWNSGVVVKFMIHLCRYVIVHECFWGGSI